MIEVSHISKSFNGKKALDDVSLSVGPCETVCIIGSMGSGKSTLLRCIAGLEFPESGEISIDGRLLERKSQDGYNHIGMVFQNFNLFPHFNVLHNLTLAPIKVLGMSEKAAEEQALHQLKKVGLGEKANLYPHELSAGQRQRVAIARCLMMKPRLMLFDEPTSALDPMATAEVMDVMRKLKKEIPLVIITHKLSLVKEIADHVVFMQNGKICEEGLPTELLNAPNQAETRSFLSYQKNMIYRIGHVNFDRPELNARIECYCNRFGLGTQAFHFVQLVVEELLNLLPLENGVDLVLAKSDNEVRMSLDVVLPFSETMYLNPMQAKDDLSLSIIEGLCEVMQETTDVEGSKLIHLELNKERLLMN
jgi:putative glutamine transport system ATP-binding protein